MWMIENKISELELRTTEFTQFEQQGENTFSKNSLRNLWNNNKKFNVCVTGVPEGEERELN